MHSDTIADFTIRDFHDSDFVPVQALWLPLGLGSSQRGDTLQVIKSTLLAGGKFLVLEEKATGKLIGTSWMTVDGRRNYL
ncbi:MAG TPA: hypothetical protein PLP88_13650, partial [Bacteroidales bacterium]|nr:hypothetical protein [Bacteroidales bacterium]